MEGPHIDMRTILERKLPPLNPGRKKKRRHNKSTLPPNLEELELLELQGFIEYQVSKNESPCKVSF